MGNVADWRASARKIPVSRLLRRLGLALRALLVAAIGAMALFGPWRDPEAKSSTRKEPPVREAALEGRASVIDGDTIRIQGERVRLNGVDAPESRQLCEDARGGPYRCGSVAANALDAFLAASRPTRCEFISRDRYGRFVGTCARADGADLSGWLVRNGYAVEWTRYSHGRYTPDQEAARARKAGVWQGRFDMPWKWRAAHAKGADGGE